VAQAQAGAGFRHLALEAGGGARVDDLRGLAADQPLHVRHVAHQLGVEPGRKMALATAARLAVPQRTSLGLPFLEAAVQHADVLMAHGAEHPPHARGRVEAFAVVGHDLHAVADAHLLHAAGEQLRGGEHVRQGRGLVGDIVDVEEERARDVLGEVFVEDDEIRRVQMRCQPLRLDQPPACVVSHCVSSGHTRPPDHRRRACGPAKV
jgi:hypothetical protein